MIKAKIILMLFVLVSVVPAAYSADASKASTQSAATGMTDTRQLVEMPEQARQFMRDDMLLHLSALNQIFMHLADNNLEAAAEVAESQLGESAMGKHRGSGMGPGRFMPLEMRKLGWSMHESASEFARVVKKGDMAESYKALQQVTSACVACHYSYRNR
jgi:hypothetical protein